MKKQPTARSKNNTMTKQPYYDIKKQHFYIIAFDLIKN